MLKSKLNTNTGILSFICPFCGNDDVFYIHMPDKCWHCGEKYTFDIIRLTINQYNRYKYYKYEEAYSALPIY